MISFILKFFHPMRKVNKTRTKTLRTLNMFQKAYSKLAEINEEISVAKQKYLDKIDSHYVSISNLNDSITDMHDQINGNEKIMYELEKYVPTSSK